MKTCPNPERVTPTLLKKHPLRCVLEKETMLDLNPPSLEHVMVSALLLLIDSPDVHSASKRNDLYCVKATLTAFPAAVATRTPINHEVTLTETLSQSGGRSNIQFSAVSSVTDAFNRVVWIITSTFTSLELGFVTRLLTFRIYLSNYF